MKDALRLYERILHVQSGIAARHQPSVNTAAGVREQIDIRAVYPELRAILSESQSVGPEQLRDSAGQLQGLGENAWRELLEVAVQSASTLSGAEDFFARACLQPVAENLQVQLEQDPHYNRAVCPTCGGGPQMSLLRPEGEGASRSLLCSFCLCEWTFRRLLCPWCGEENKEKLPRYSAERYTSVHVEACDVCLRYLKAIDMTVDGHAVPLVDEAASAVLDVWAVERGYTKIVPNLIGF